MGILQTESLELGSCLRNLYPTDTRLQAKLFDCLLGDGEAAGGGAVV